MNFYFIGIGGAGMSVIAELLAAQGAKVAGSDARDSQATARLRAAGIEVFLGHDPSHVPAEAIVVVSSAIRDSNPELSQARARGQRILHRSQALALAAHDSQFVAVAGAHGKSTTAAMIATALSRIGADPSWAIGATVRGLGDGARLGSGKIFVAEADESDASFLNYTPRIALVTNVEPDHLDHYGTREAFEEAFLEFSRRILPGGLLIVCSEDEGAARLGFKAAHEGIRVRSYGRGSGLLAAGKGYEGHVSLVLPESHTCGARAHVSFDRRGQERVSADLHLAVPGVHNYLNSTGAWLVGLEVGVEGSEMAKALASFTGTGRRFELRAHVRGVRIIDDYAHHPTEVAATLAAAREEVGEGRVRVLFQPHLYSRTKTFAREFATALDKADDVIVTGVYAAREDVDPHVEGNLITDLMRCATFVPQKEEAARILAHRARPGDILLTMGAGDVTEMGRVIEEELT